MCQSFVLVMFTAAIFTPYGRAGRLCAFLLGGSNIQNT